MRVCGQTLVLIDNDATVSAVNQKLVRATLKYMFYHAPENRTFCLNTYEHGLVSEETYTDQINDLVCDVDRIEFEPKDSNLCDVICEVITGWKESDFACRNILVFTDGLEGAASSHEKEELYYLLENSEYPVYVVMLDQDNNAEARKQLSAIAVTSGGKFFESEFEGSDAEVDRQLSEAVFGEMDGYAQAHWAKYEEPKEEAEDDGKDDRGNESGDGKTDADKEEEEYVTDTSEEIAAENSGPEEITGDGIIYEYDPPPGFFENTTSLVLAAGFIAVGLIVAVFGSFVMMKKKNRAGRTARCAPQTDEEFFEDYELKGMNTTDLADDAESDTVLLSGSVQGYDCATRLLEDPKTELMLTDRDDRGRKYRIVVGGIMTIGRGDCDVVITGDDALSKRHCEISEKEGKIYVRDLSSSNGTRINGKKISESFLESGDELTVGARTYIAEVV